MSVIYNEKKFMSMGRFFIGLKSSTGKPVVPKNTPDGATSYFLNREVELECYLTDTGDITVVIVGIPEPVESLGG